MRDKIVLITGATAGIGKATAIGLAKKGANIVIVGRNAAKAQKAIDEIKQESGNGDIHFLTADLSSIKSVKQLVEDFKANYTHLDVLINNAGAVFNQLEKSVDGIEMQIATNHIAPFVLTNGLLDMLKAAPQGRIVNVASNAHYLYKSINWDDIYMSKGYDGLKMYAQTKLFNVLFTIEMVERLKGSKVTVNALHPGFVRTEIGNKHGGLFYKIMWTLGTAFAISVEKGAATSIYLASSPDVANENGKYWANCKHKWQSYYSQTEGLKEKLWAETEKLVK